MTEEKIVGILADIMAAEIGTFLANMAACRLFEELSKVDDGATILADLVASYLDTQDNA